MGSKFFPLTINLQGKNVLIIGAGKIAFRKAKILLHYGCKIRVIAKEVLEEGFFALREEKKIVLEENRCFQESDLEDVFLVVAATSDEPLNKEIAEQCQQKNILVNNSSSKEDMNVRFASIYENEDFQIGVSAYGNPKKAKEIKNRIQEFFEKK